MHIVRPIRESDIEHFIAIAHEASIGITSMPKNRQALLRRVELSLKSFSHPVSHAGDESYLFVIEDLETNKIGGTCGIIAKTGRQCPLSFFHVTRNEVHKGIEGTKKIAPLLRVVHYRNHWTEICSLYLCSHFRLGGLGRLLSLSRFHYIASHIQRFEKMTFAEMRGYIDKNNNSPFWEGIGRHFIDTDFEKLMRLRDEEKIDLREILPVHPIYIELLPHHVQEAIGKLHTETIPAIKLLSKEGFIETGDIDICDGGPKIAVETTAIRTVRASFIAKVGKISTEKITSEPYLLSTIGTSFRACLSAVQLEAGIITLPVNTAEALEVSVGDDLRYSLAHAPTEKITGIHQ